MIEMIDVNEIAEYSATTAALAELAGRLKDVAYDVTQPKGMAVAKADRAEVRGLRTSLEAKRKEIKAPALAHCKLIDDEAKRITVELMTLETPIDEQIKARELVLESEKIAREAVEHKRIKAITGMISDIRGYADMATNCRTSERVHALQESLKNSPISSADFEEFADEATAVMTQTIARMKGIYESRVTDEAERAKAKAEQAEAAEQLKIERDAMAAERLAAQQIADAQALAMKAERDAFLLEQSNARAAQQAEADKIAKARIELDREIAKKAIREAPVVAPAPAAVAVIPKIEEVATPTVRLSAPRNLFSDTPTTRQQINGCLDALQETDLLRVLSFINSRWPIALAA
jgi:hypothetical protein